MIKKMGHITQKRYEKIKEYFVKKYGIKEKFDPIDKPRKNPWIHPMKTKDFCSGKIDHYNFAYWENQSDRNLVHLYLPNEYIKILQDMGVNISLKVSTSKWQGVEVDMIIRYDKEINEAIKVLEYALHLFPGKGLIQ